MKEHEPTLYFLLKYFIKLVPIKLFLPIIKIFRPNGEFIKMDVILIEGKLEFQSLGHATVILKEE